MKSLSLLLAAVGLKSALGAMDAVRSAFPLAEEAAQEPEYAHQIEASASLASRFAQDRRTSAFVTYAEYKTTDGGNATVATGASERIDCDTSAGLTTSQNLPYVPSSGKCIHTVHTVTMPGSTYKFKATATTPYVDMLSTLSDLGLSNDYPVQAQVTGKFGQIDGTDKTYTVAEVEYEVHCYAPEDLAGAPNSGTQNDAYGIREFKEADIVSQKRYYDIDGNAIAAEGSDMALSLAGAASPADVTAIRMYADITVAASRTGVAKNVCGFQVDVDQRDLVTIEHVGLGENAAKTALKEGGMSTSDVLFEHDEVLTFAGLTPDIQDTVGTGGSFSEFALSEETAETIEDTADTHAILVEDRNLFLECGTTLSSWAKYDTITWTNDPTVPNSQGGGQNKSVYIETPILIHEVTTCDRVHFVSPFSDGDGEEIATHIEPYKLGPDGIVTTGAHTNTEWAPYILASNPFDPTYNVATAPWVSDMSAGHSAFSVIYRLDDALGGVHSCCNERHAADGENTPCVSGLVPLEGEGENTQWDALSPVDLCSNDPLTLQLALLKGNTLDHGFERLWLARTDARHEEQGLTVKMSVFTHTRIGDQTA